MLAFDPKIRPTASECLMHAFFQQDPMWFVRAFKVPFIYYIYLFSCFIIHTKFHLIIIITINYVSQHLLHVNDHNSHTTSLGIFVFLCIEQSCWSTVFSSKVTIKYIMDTHSVPAHAYLGRVQFQIKIFVKYDDCCVNSFKARSIKCVLIYLTVISKLTWLNSILSKCVNRAL